MHEVAKELSDTDKRTDGPTSSVEKLPCFLDFSISYPRVMCGVCLGLQKQVRLSIEFLFVDKSLVKVYQNCKFITLNPLTPFLKPQLES